MNGRGIIHFANLGEWMEKGREREGEGGGREPGRDKIRLHFRLAATLRSANVVHFLRPRWEIQYEVEVNVLKRHDDDAS